MRESIWLMVLGLGLLGADLIAQAKAGLKTLRRFLGMDGAGVNFLDAEARAMSKWRGAWAWQ
jgi:hypothetical protein